MRHIIFAISLLGKGDIKHFLYLFFFRIYRMFYLFIWYFRDSNYKVTISNLRLKTLYPIALESPDNTHQRGSGSSHDNSTNKAFILKLSSIFQDNSPSILDLGCSGGKLVYDFLHSGWFAIGLDGSKAVLNRPLWKKLYDRNLFSCDISKPFELLKYEEIFQFDVVTLWDVIEHIPEKSLDQLFINIYKHLKPTGLLILSTSEKSAIYEGIEYHQTQWPIWKWKNFIESLCWLKPVDINLRPFDAVKLTYGEESLLVYEKQKPIGVSSQRMEELTTV